MINRVRVIAIVAMTSIVVNGLVFGEADRDKGRLPEMYGKVKTIQLVVEQSYDQAQTISLPVEATVRRILETSGFRVVNASAVNYDARLSLMVSGEAYMEKYGGGPQYSGARVKGDLVLGTENTVWWTDSFEGLIPPPEFILGYYNRPSDAPFKKAYEISGMPLTIYSAAYAMGVDRSLDFVTEALRDRQSAIRWKALDELGRFEVPQVLSSVRSMLSDSEPKVKIRVLQLLSAYSDKNSVIAIEGLLGDKNIDVRRQAAQALGEIRDSRAIKPLINVIKKDSLIRMSATEALKKIGEPSVEPLIALLQEKDLDGLAQEAVIETLGELKDPRASAALIAALRTSDSWGRKKTVDALYKIGNNATNPLIAALKDPEPLVREGVTEVLGRLKVPQSLGPLSALLEDPVPEVRARAAWALGELGDEQAISALANIADHDPDESVRNAAQTAIKRIKFH